MTDETAEPDADAPPKKSKLPLLVGVVLALAGAGGGFFIVSSGMIGGGARATESAEPAAPEPLAPVAFLPLDPIVISLPPRSGGGHLKFTAQLEVPPEELAQVAAIQPRIVDVLNGYLRAVDLGDLEDPAMLIRLRAQMLHRIGVVAGEGRVNDLLIMEFVTN
ncbi:flagellar basal body-associated protein FliL [Oceanicola granulosus HTCC2516]|uniref:Flagellar protein FliL n=1 Tax=Oceanicola granulosus (strain ATCC BAA-861 / DSM 15982 / KCTC 12143 / HTCC2516) TaxID=314256 RepID=Q2CDI9_OCEGH|nr:flagellar basal body-associated FliL family protein [Oceanicola granulosus]EAR50722.1 flagellar basal body-associated protein FliL [Oceanicola granulosus HTCC2516]